MADTITVTSALPVAADGSSRVALYERDRAHPGGEVFIAGDKPVTVARTSEVNRLLREGVLVEAETPAPAEPPKKPA